MMRTLALWACLLMASLVFGNEYRVQKGDTVEKIANKLGVPASEIRKANPGLKETRMQIGQKLNIPSKKKTSKTSNRSSRTTASQPKSNRPTTSYTVKSGDNNWDLARRFNISVGELSALNGGRDLTNLRPGQKINVPGRATQTTAKKPATKPAAKPTVASAKAPAKPATPTKPAVALAKISGDFARINVDSATLRKLPKTSAGRVSTVSRNQVGKIIDRRPEWYELRFPSGTKGWVRGDLVAEANADQVTAFNAAVSRVEEQRRRQALARAEKAKERGNRVAVSDSGSASGVVADAKELLGTRYVWGGTSRGGFDCSGFVLYVMRKSGIRLPRTSIEQSRVGTFVSRGDLRTGDLVFFNTRGSRISHVGIYLGDGKFIHASSGGGRVRIDSLSARYYNSRYVTALRVGNFDSVSKAVEEVQRELEEAGELPTPASEPELRTRSGTDEILK